MLARRARVTGARRKEGEGREGRGRKIDREEEER